MESPCYNCEKRTSGCHSSCEEYKDYNSKIKSIHSAKFNANFARGLVDGYEIGPKSKRLKRYRRNKK